MKYVKAADTGRPLVADSRSWQWQDAASCAGMPLALFYGAPGERDRVLREQRALAVCATCPVRTTCLDVALQEQPTGQYGVQGGMTAEQRIRERRKRMRRDQGPRAEPKRTPVPRPKPRMVDATGTRRRLQALAAVGHGAPVVARNISYLASPSQLNRVRSGETPTVSAEAAEALAAVYPNLCAQAPVKNSYGAADEAAAKGWPPPNAWDNDEHLDDPTTQPHVFERSAA